MHGIFSSRIHNAAIRIVFTLLGQKSSYPSWITWSYGITSFNVKLVTITLGKAVACILFDLVQRFTILMPWKHKRCPRAYRCTAVIPFTLPSEHLYDCTSVRLSIYVGQSHWATDTGADGRFHRRRLQCTFKFFFLLAGVFVSRYFPIQYRLKICEMPGWSTTRLPDLSRNDKDLF